MSADVPTADVTPPVAEAAAPAMSRAAVGYAAVASAGAAPTAPAAAVPRMIVRSAEMSLQVADVRKASDQIAEATVASGGFLGASRQWREGDRDRASMTVRVPAAKLDATLARLRTLAVRVDNEAVTGEDVTRQAVDLNAQLTNLRATETELRALLSTVREKAKRAADILEVHEELSRVRGQIDQHEAELASLTQLAALSTITLDLRPDVVATPIATESWQPRGVLRDAVRALAGTGRIIVSAMIWATVYGVPMLMLALLLVLAGRRVWPRAKAML
jgi:cell division protein FtsB